MPPHSGDGRFGPDWLLPPYAHLPGHTPHPLRDTGGHGHGLPDDAFRAVAPDDWRTCPAFLHGIDLFNVGYPWEAHEVWEDLWRLYPPESASATILQTLIKLAACAVKARLGNVNGVDRHRAKALRHLTKLARTHDLFGLAVEDLYGFAAALSPEAAGARGHLAVTLRPGEHPSVV